MPQSVKSRWWFFIIKDCSDPIVLYDIISASDYLCVSISGPDIVGHVFYNSACVAPYSLLPNVTSTFCPSSTAMYHAFKDHAYYTSSYCSYGILPNHYTRVQPVQIIH